jgi:hypothetical protein
LGRRSECEELDRLIADLHAGQSRAMVIWGQPVFDGHEASRRRHGATGPGVLPYGNQVTILIDFPDRGLAAAFGFDPTLPDLMSRAGVVNAPEIESVELSEQRSC